VWWPNGNYEPIRAGERGTIADGLSSLPRFTSAPSTVAAPLERIDDENAGQAHPGVRRSGDAHEKVGSEEPIHNEGYSSPAPSGSAPAPAPSTTTGATASGTATTTPTTTNRATTNSGTTAGSPAAGGSGTDAGADNQAVAINTKDGESLFSFAFSIRRADGDLVDDRNLAFAYASCKACQTLAVAIQVVLIMSDAHVITPLNQAVAINDECIACETVALAHQYVIGVGAPIDFTADGNARIAEIRRRFLALERSGLPMADTVARAEALAAGVEQVLGTELVPTASAGRSSSEGGGDASDGTTGSAQESTPHVSATPASNDAGTATQGDQPAGEQATTQDQAPAANQRPTVEGATTLPDKPTDGSTVPGPEVGTTGPSGASTVVAGQ
jgi:putative peptide zinc metalloprotease protein